jgi:glutamate N-acetyltransferase / amino-acid N-acetyltransferase
MPDADVSQRSLSLGDQCIFSNGKFVLEGDEVEKALSGHMQSAEYGDNTDYPPHQKFVEIGVDFGSTAMVGETSSVVVLGSDLTQEYVVINADYRS